MRRWSPGQPGLRLVAVHAHGRAPSAPGCGATWTGCCPRRGSKRLRGAVTSRARSSVCRSRIVARQRAAGDRADGAPAETVARTLRPTRGRLVLADAGSVADLLAERASPHRLSQIVASLGGVRRTRPGLGTIVAPQPR